MFLKTFHPKTLILFLCWFRRLKRLWRGYIILWYQFISVTQHLRHSTTFLGQQPMLSAEDADTARFIDWLSVFCSVSLCTNAS